MNRNKRLIGAGLCWLAAGFVGVMWTIAPPSEAPAVAWYVEHPTMRQWKMQECGSDPIAYMTRDDCGNAQGAGDQLFSEELQRQADRVPAPAAPHHDDRVDI